MSVSGEVQRRELPDVVIRKVSVSAQDNNAYLLTCRVTGDQLLIDAADDVPRLTALLDAGRADGGDGLSRIVTTHRHWDHHRALASLAGMTGARTVAGRDDAAGLPLPPDELVDHGDVVPLGAQKLAVVQLRGHTPGSIALILHSADHSVHAFTGDSLFPGGVGNTDHEADRFNTLIDDVSQRLFAVLPDDTCVYPGHGRDTTLGTERPHLASWRARGW